MSKIETLGEIYWWIPLDMVSSGTWKISRSTHSRSISILNSNSTWPDWFDVHQVQSRFQECFKKQAEVLWFSNQEIDSIWRINLLSIVHICQNNEGCLPDKPTSYWGFLNTFFIEDLPEDLDLSDFIKSLLNPIFTNISLYPHRMVNMDAFTAGLYHEITHLLLDIRFAQIAIKKWKNIQELRDFKSSNTATIIHEAMAHLEAGQRIVLNNKNEAWVKSGSDWRQSSENNPYKLWAHIWHMIYTTQIGIHNELFLSQNSQQIKLNSENYQRFEKWWLWIRDELIECSFDEWRLELIVWILNQYENNPREFLEFFETKILPIL